MFNLAQNECRISAMDANSIDRVRELEQIVLSAPQVETPTTHTLHSGVYTRTIMISAGVILTGALIKIATTLIVCGDVAVYVGDKSIRLNGYNVYAASANRKQAFVAYTDTYITMIFKTYVKTVEEAEEQFTDDAHRLMSRHTDALNNFIITGE